MRKTISLSILVCLFASASVRGATHHSDNFTVRASSDRVAKSAARAAEGYRGQLADEWLGNKLPRWARRCVITIDTGANRPAGNTSFTFIGGRVANLRITLRGPLDDVMREVLPHEITHAVFATYFRRAIPRWADEGAATLSESQQVQSRQRLRVVDILSSRKGIPLSTLMGMTRYPAGRTQMMAVYVQGFSLVDFLVQKQGKRPFIKFLQEAFAGRTDKYASDRVHAGRNDRRASDRVHFNNWDRAVRKTYGYRSLDELERQWQSWATKKNKPQEKKPAAKPAQGIWV